MKEIPLKDAYQLVEPGPTTLLTTRHEGRANVMTLSWHMVVDFTPRLACVVSEANFSHAALRATGECVIAIPDVGLAAKAVEIGNCSGREVRKFEAFGLTPKPAHKVGAPLVAECFANLECRVVDAQLADTYNLFILEVVMAWRDPRKKAPKTIHHQGYGRFIVDGETIELPSNMP
ncbi:flavin reductase family protein [Methylocella sp.]|uniref:flavin reductase family protein n=1 Tax=Methylocella sp. TaxID=1978226 RepID=UPI0037845D57